MAKARSFLFAFKYSDKVAYVVEFSHYLIRIYSGKHALLGDDGVCDISDDDVGVSDEYPPFEIVSPYGFADLWDEAEKCCKLQTIQNCDVLYIFNEKYPIMVLKRYAHNDWRLEELELKNGPFLAMNTENTMIKSDALEGEVVLTASTDLFRDTDVGRLIRLRAFDDDTKPWVAGRDVVADDVYVSDNKYYKAKNDGVTGSVKPVHSEGTKSDGGVQWKYLHDGTGIVKITEFIDAKNVKADVLSMLSDKVIEGTVCWEMGMLHQGAKYPISGAFFRNRFVFLVNTDNGPNVCMSVSGDYNNFADMEFGMATAETAITVPVLNTEFNEGKWVFAGDVLFVGTGAGEFYVDTLSASSAMASDNVKIAQISCVGSKAIKPVGIGAHVFFVDRYGLSLRDLMYNYYNDGYDQIDISLLGKHLFQSRIIDICYQEVPDKILWCLAGDGSLTALTFSAEQEVAALSRHDFSGVAESIAIVPNLTECRDELWIEVKRIINGDTLRTVEYMENGMPQFWPAGVYSVSSISEQKMLQADYVRQMARYLDGAVLFERSLGDDAVEIRGLEHLEGCIVEVFADGVVLPSQVVLGGKISIGKKFVKVLVGLKVVSQFVPQNIFIPNTMGSGIGERKRINHVLLMLYMSGGGRVGKDENNLNDILYRAVDEKMGEPQRLFSGNKEILFNGATCTQESSCGIFIENDTPLPMNILAIVPYMD